MYISTRCAPLVSNTVRRRFGEVQLILADHSIEIRLLEGGRVSLWHTGPFGDPEPRERQDLMSVVVEQLPLTKDER